MSRGRVKVWGTVLLAFVVMGGSLFSYSWLKRPEKKGVLNDQLINRVSWFGVREAVKVGEPIAPVISVVAPAWILKGTSLFSSAHWALVGGVGELPAEGVWAKMNMSDQWVKEGQHIGEYYIKAIRSDEMIVLKGTTEWSFKLAGTVSASSSQTTKVVCDGAIKVPKMALEVLNQQQALLLNGIVATPQGGVTVRPELAALLGGLGFLSGDVLLKVGDRLIVQANYVVAYVISPLIRGQLVHMVGKRGGQQKEWSIVSELVCQ